MQNNVKLIHMNVIILEYMLTFQGTDSMCLSMSPDVI